MKHILAIFWYRIRRLTEKTGFPFTNQCMIPVLYYHSVNPRYNPSGFRVSPDNFECQIRYLTSNYNVISLSALIDCIHKREVLKNSVVLTFDDGYMDNYSYAYPILKKYNCPATIFIATGFVNGEITLVENSERLEALGWQEIAEMGKNELITFGAHGHTHNRLTDISLENADIEMKKSKKMLEERLQREICHFSYPDGQFNKDIMALAKNNNFDSASSTIHSISNSKKKLYMLNRVIIEGRDDLEIFKLKLHGAYDYLGFLHHFRIYKNAFVRNCCPR